MSQVGKLFFNRMEGRVDIKYPDGDTHGGLRCGDVVEINVDGEWKATRLEYDRQRGAWYSYDGYDLAIGMQARTPER